ncbi:response regulator [Methanoregula sp. UBA64]|jgi:PAS domain S-box-containing protein|uniref:ATP-binding response regulator n=1 Tax=Methanoregula sp. UBA64 TaxID=1915554 RepID=UPI0025F81494|nr:response regulator [Methanoregula sp. UBA64]
MPAHESKKQEGNGNSSREHILIRKENMNKILIVEDEAVTAMELEETLKRRGYLVVGTASNGPDALRIAKDRWPDLILMDIRIQGPMDGIETADQINVFYEIPIIFLTAYSDDLTISRVIKTKSYSFLLKPFNEKELISNIEMAINKQRMYARSLAIQRIVTSMFDLVSDCVVTTDPEGNVLRVNATFERVAGISRDDVIGKPLREVLPVSCTSWSWLDMLIKEACTERETVVRWPYPVEILQENGNSVSMNLNVELLALPDQTLIEILYIFTRRE